MFGSKNYLMSMSTRERLFSIYDVGAKTNINDADSKITPTTIQIRKLESNLQQILKSKRQVTEDVKRRYVGPETT